MELKPQPHRRVFGDDPLRQVPGPQHVRIGEKMTVQRFRKFLVATKSFAHLKSAALEMTNLSWSRPFNAARFFSKKEPAMPLPGHLTSTMRTHPAQARICPGCRWFPREPYNFCQEARGTAPEFPAAKGAPRR